jgi:hypothetical protein
MLQQYHQSITILPYIPTRFHLPPNHCAACAHHSIAPSSPSSLRLRWLLLPATTASPPNRPLCVRSRQAGAGGAPARTPPSKSLCRRSTSRKERAADGKGPSWGSPHLHRHRPPLLLSPQQLPLPLIVVRVRTRAHAPSAAVSLMLPPDCCGSSC